MQDKITAALIVTLLLALAIYVLVAYYPVSTEQTQRSSVQHHQGKLASKVAHTSKPLADSSVQTLPSPDRHAITQPHQRPQSSQTAERIHREFLAMRRRVLDPGGGLIDQYQLFSAQLAQQILQLPELPTALFLQGIPRNQHYDAIQYTLSSASSEYVLAIQIWLDQPANIKQRWEQQTRSYPAVKLLHPSTIGHSAFRAYRAPLYYLNFSVVGGKALVSISCNQRFCPTGKHLEQIAHQILSRLNKTTVQHPSFGSDKH
jgi:hypothetical protein